MKVSISLALAEQQMLDEVLDGAPYANPHALAKLAVKIGLDILRREPGRIPALLSGQRLRFTPIANAAETKGATR
jgi:hypothetical protein